MDLDLEGADERQGGCTPLHFAASFALSSTVQLLAAGADPFAENVDGETPLEWCLRRSTDRLRDFRLYPREKVVVARADAPTPRGGDWVVTSVNQGGRQAGDINRDAPTLRYEEFVVAAAIHAAENAGEYGSERARAAFAAAAETGAAAGAQPSALACLRLAADGVPTAWKRGNARAWPHPWRETVNCLLLCRRREEVATGWGCSETTCLTRYSRAPRAAGACGPPSFARSTFAPASRRSPSACLSSISHSRRPNCRCLSTRAECGYGRGGGEGVTARQRRWAITRRRTLRATCILTSHHTLKRETKYLENLEMWCSVAGKL